MRSVSRGYLYREKPEAASLSFGDTIAVLQAGGYLAAGESWWFAWREQDLILPQLLTEVATLPIDWDVLHLFSPRIEVRQIRRGKQWQRLLLSEEESLQERASAQWLPDQSYRSVGSHRILWGGLLRLPDGPVRGNVRFPRTLDYGTPNEDANHPERAVVADVQLYYDNEARLQTVRYLRVRHVVPGVDSMRVAPLI